MVAAPGVPFDNGRFEIAVQDAPTDLPVTVGGFPLERVASLRWDEPSVWTADERRQLTRRVGRRVGPLVQIDGL